MTSARRTGPLPSRCRGCRADCRSAGLRGGSLLLSDPERERAMGCREAFMSELASLGAEVAAEPLPPAPGLADAEPIVLVRAEFAPSSRL